MRQDHEHVPRGEGEHAPEKGAQAEEVFSFQEITYPSRLKLWLERFIHILADRRLQYFIGIIVGAIPLAALLLSVGILRTSAVVGILGQIASYGFIAVLIGMIVCLFIPQVRFVGYGLLTMVLISPVVYYISCTISMHNLCGYRYNPCR